MSNISQAINWFSRGETIQLNGDQFVKGNTSQRIQRFFSRDQDKTQIKKMANFIQTKLAEASSPADKESYLLLAKSFIKRYGTHWNGEKIARSFDRAIVIHRPAVEFGVAANQKKFEKWTHNGMPAEIYQKHPKFCTFLETTGLLSQMKITRDTIREIEGEPAILVKGEWTKGSTVEKQFEPMTSKRYGETFIVHKETREVYTYLDNGKGLQPHHPYISESNPTSLLNEEDYGKVLTKAHTFVRPGEEQLGVEERAKLNAERPFVLQLVTSYVKGPNTRFHELLRKPRHPYLRVVVGQDNPEQNVRKGEVYDVGYGWKKKMSIPLIASQGQFRSPDVWEYGHCDERLVTNIPISQKEARELRQYTLRYHRDGVNLGNPVGFHIMRQNCSSYASKALEVVGVKISSQITLAEFVHEIAPAWIAKVADFFAEARKKIKQGLNWTIGVLPKGLRNFLSNTAEKVSYVFHKALEMITALVIVPLHAAMGGMLGKGGKAFVRPDEPEKHLGPSLSSWRNWLSLSTYHINLPGILQRWQREQASTVVYDKPVKLTIVPN